MDTRRRSKPLISVPAIVLAAVAPTLVGTSTASASPATSRGPSAVPIGTAPRLPPGAVDLGRLPSSTQLRFDVALKVPDPSGLAVFVRGVSTPGSPSFHRFLKAGQFADRFGPSMATVEAVEQSLRSQGVTPLSVTPDRLTIHARASAAAVSSGWHTELHRYRLSDGRTAFANRSAPSLPSSVASYVQGVVGLDDLAHLSPLGLHALGAGSPASTSTSAQPRVLAHDTAAAPCGAATTASASGGASALTADKLASAYGFTSMYSGSDFGTGATVALFELSTFAATDIATYETCYGTASETPAIETTSVDGGPKAVRGGPLEVTLDIEDVIGLDPGAQVDVYEGPDTQTGVNDTYQQIVTDDTAQVVSTSWGQCESPPIQSEANIENTIFEEAAAQGQSVMAASGDTGSEDCYPSTSALAVDDPGSQPYVTSVGGTSLSVNGSGQRASETVWDNSYGAGGGGVSSFWPMAQWQTGAPSFLKVVATSTGSSGTPCGASAGSYCREVPDVSADADPLTGSVVYQNSSWKIVGGTSMAAPLWGALVAIVDASGACAGEPVGYLSPALYTVAGSSSSEYGQSFYDVVSGNNDVLGVHNGMYTSQSGYDMASGLGTPNLSALAGALCQPIVTALSPSSGPAAGGNTVTISGIRFSTTPGAVTVSFGSQPATGVSCTSSTTCSVTAPTGVGAAAVEVTVNAQQSLPSTSDMYHYVPSVTSVTPSSGLSSGDTSVTVDGAGFSTSGGGTTIDFGNNPATNVTCSTSSSCTVTDPSGSGPVDVTAVVAGERSPTSGADQFTYTTAPAAPYSAIAPTRICDTRPGNPSGLSGPAAQCNGGSGNPGSTLSAYTPLKIGVAGQFTVPGDASAVVLNVTVVNPGAAGYLTVYPTGQQPPTASNLNFTAGEVVPNLVEVGTGFAGQVSFISSVATNVVVDLEGYVDSTSNQGTGGGLYHALPQPARICDTRPGNPSNLSGGDAQCNGAGNAGRTLPSGGKLNVLVAGNGGVPPSGVSAVVLNVTAVNPIASGYLTVYPEDAAQPFASNVNYRANQVVPNRVMVPVSSISPTGWITVYASAQTDVVVDVSGWFSTSGGTGTQFTAEPAPARICDTRPGNPSGLSGAVAQCNGSANSGTTLGPRGTATINTAGIAGVPSGASAVVLNVTAVAPTTLTYLTVFPSGSPPLVSDLNPAPGEIEPNMVVATVSGTSIEIYNAFGNVNVVVDVLGWYS